MFCQFFVANGELSCLMYQRSCDMGLGVPFNIASYALLTRLIAQCCDLKAGELIHVRTISMRGGGARATARFASLLTRARSLALQLSRVTACAWWVGQNMGDTHVYLNHMEPLQEQLAREPRPFPTLNINPDVKDIDGFSYSDFEIVGYSPHKKIAMDMVRRNTLPKPDRATIAVCARCRCGCGC
jgi:dihydrofolate reductase/thymidylate synthase